MKTIKRVMSAAIAGALVLGAMPVNRTAMEEVVLNADAVDLIESDAAAPGNLSANNYEDFASPVRSYLYEEDGGTFCRVENIGEQVIVESLDKDMKLIKSNTIKCELARFGGFFHGNDYNFLVYGQDNLSESNSAEVFRVVKYSKNWEKLATLSIKGSNTYMPFNAGSLRMTELNGNLYIYTCRLQYKTGDGYNHQCNISFKVNEENMAIADQYYEWADNPTGFVSHSMNQYIVTDGDFVYRVDHGDCFPRGFYISKVSVNNKLSDLDSYTTVFHFTGWDGDNETGASLGGVELSGDKLILTGNTIPTDTDDLYAQRNIFVAVVDKNNIGSNEVKYITAHTADDGVTARTPQLVKTGDDRFLLIWEEADYNEDEWRYDYSRTKAVVLDGNGDLVGSPVEVEARLSDCKPIYCSDGIVRWYAGDDKLNVYAADPADPTKPVIPETPPAATTTEPPVTTTETTTTVPVTTVVTTTAEPVITTTEAAPPTSEPVIIPTTAPAVTTDPAQTTTPVTPPAKAALGDVDGNGSVDSADASAVLAEYAAQSTGDKSTFTELQTKLGDVNGSGAIDADDASKILAFYSHVSTGGKYTKMEDWLKYGDD